MRKILIRAALALVGIAILWLFTARQLSLLLDRFLTIRVNSLPVSPLSYSPGVLWISGLAVELTTNGDVGTPRLYSDSQEHVVVEINGQTVQLGTRSGSHQSHGGDFGIVPDPGDRVSLTVSRSIMSWPTPLELNFMTGHAPSWKRHLYYRLEWNEASGKKLTMVWRFEQWFYPSLGWASGMMTHEGSTGLLRADIAG